MTFLSALTEALDTAVDEWMRAQLSELECERTVGAAAITALRTTLATHGLRRLPLVATGPMRLAGSLEKNAHRLTRSRFKTGVPDIYAAMVAAAGDALAAEEKRDG